MNSSHTKNIAVILNSNQLGGAERSLGEQLAVLESKDQFTFFIPKLTLPDTALVEFLKAKGFKNFIECPYPSFLYNISREGISKVLLILFFFPVILWHVFLWHRHFRHFSRFYANGNKASFPPLCWSFIFRKKIELYWHFRDFPSGSFFKVIRIILMISGVKKKLVSFHLIANSQAVARELKKYFPDQKIDYLYNLAGALPPRASGRRIRHIGIASMFTEWKGLHSVILMLSIFEKELQELGVEKVIFFGENIYQTAGLHQSYTAQIYKLVRKLEVTSVEWGGHVSPGDIFSKIDLLIHPSLRPEPFGRVILEAFKANTPVISSGLGGAAELIGNNERGLLFISHDYQGLFQAIRALIIDERLRSSLTRDAFQKAQIIETEVKRRVQQIF